MRALTNKKGFLLLETLLGVIVLILIVGAVATLVFWKPKTPTSPQPVATEPNVNSTSQVTESEPIKDPTLVGYWNFDETSGTTVNDVSGNGNPGTLIKSARRIAGVMGSALSLNGVDSFVAIQHSNLFDVSQLSIVMWIKTPNDMGQTWRNLISKQHTQGNIYPIPYLRDYNFYAQSDNGDPRVTALHFSSIWGVSAATLPTPYDSGGWHQVAVTVDGNGLVKYYSDGEFLAQYQGLPTKALQDYPLLIGAADNFWKGAIDEVRLYNRPLTADEIRALYLGVQG